MLGGLCCGKSSSDIAFEKVHLSEGRTQACVGTLSYTLPLSAHISGTHSELGKPVDVGSGGEMLWWNYRREGPRLKQLCIPQKTLVQGASSRHLQSLLQPTEQPCLPPPSAQPRPSGYGDTKLRAKRSEAASHMDIRRKSPDRGTSPKTSRQNWAVTGQCCCKVVSRECSLVLPLCPPSCVSLGI